MLEELRLFIVLKLYILKMYVKEKIKLKWFYKNWSFAAKAFTLAEVLITLLIIGIVASIVIPTLINDTQDAELKVALKKTYSELSQAARLISFENGGSFTGVLPGDDDDAGFRNIFQAHLTYLKSCDDSRSEGCWHPLSTNGGTLKKLDGTNSDGLDIYAGLILNNGAFLNFLSFRKDCSFQGSYYSKHKICGWIITDVNGFKKPNVVGKDVFYFNLLADRLVPWGDTDSLEHDCSGQGFYCAATKLVQ